MPVSNLRFGELLQGIPERVAPDDASASAEIRVTGKGRMTLVVALPASVMSPGGNSIPVQFAANDALYRIGTGEMQAFDPRSPLTVTVPGSSGAITLFVGGTVSPSSLQAPGNYTATITVQAFE